MVVEGKTLERDNEVVINRCRTGLDVGWQLS